MSDLQLGLLIIGVLVVAGVILYNKLQELRLRRGARADAPDAFREVSHGSHARAAPAGREASVEPEAHERPAISRDIEHTLAASAPPPEPEVAAPAQAATPAAPQATVRVLEEAVDCIVPLELPTATAGAEILKQAGTLAHEAMLRPIHWEALDPADGEWEPLTSAKRYRRVRAGMQLVSRAGAATEEDLGAFCLALQEISLALGAEAQLPDLEAVAQRASELDRFCADVDVQVGLNVVAAGGEAFAGTKIRALAESAGMQYGKDGRFHRSGDGGAELYGLANLESMPFHPETIRTLSTQGVTVLLDVPRAPPAAATFRAYVEFARQAEHSLGGALVDDNRKPIDQAALDSIAMQLEAIHKTMSARGIAAGGPLALRLFS